MKPLTSILCLFVSLIAWVPFSAAVVQEDSGRGQMFTTGDVIFPDFSVQTTATLQGDDGPVGPAGSTVPGLTGSQGPAGPTGPTGECGGCNATGGATTETMALLEPTDGFKGGGCYVPPIHGPALVAINMRMRQDAFNGNMTCSGSPPCTMKSCQYFWVAEYNVWDNSSTGSCNLDAPVNRVSFTTDVMPACGENQQLAAGHFGDYHTYCQEGGPAGCNETAVQEIFICSIRAMNGESPSSEEIDWSPSENYDQECEPCAVPTGGDPPPPPD